MIETKGKYRKSIVFDVLREQGRRLDWLASKTGFTAQYICKMRERSRYTRDFAEMAAQVLGLPESVLFSDEIYPEVEDLDPPM